MKRSKGGTARPKPKKLTDALAFALAQARPDEEAEAGVLIGMTQWDVDVMAVSLAIEATNSGDAYTFRCRCHQAKGDQDGSE